MIDSDALPWIFATLGFGMVLACAVGWCFGRVTAPPTLSTMEAVIDRPGMRWNEEDMRRRCSVQLQPPWSAYLTSTEVLPASDGADVGTLVCYWSLKR